MPGHHNGEKKGRGRGEEGASHCDVQCGRSQRDFSQHPHNSLSQVHILESVHVMSLTGECTACAGKNVCMYVCMFFFVEYRIGDKLVLSSLHIYNFFFYIKLQFCFFFLFFFNSWMFLVLAQLPQEYFKCQCFYLRSPSSLKLS